jgi:hypothetical protein
MISAAHTVAEALPAGEPGGGSCAASLDLGSVTRAQIEDFLYREARLLDDWDLDSWLTLWAEEGTRYVVPCNDDPDGDPARDLVLIDDDQLRMRLRVERLNSRKAHREYPHSRTNHQVSNVVVGTAEGSGARRRAAGHGGLHGVAVPQREGVLLRRPLSLPVHSGRRRAAYPV